MTVQPISGGLGLAPGQSPPPGNLPSATPTATNQSAPAGHIPSASAAPAQQKDPQAVQNDRNAVSDMRTALRDAVQRANETVQVLRSNLQFTVDEATGVDVVKFIDIKTKEVIRQIPSEEMLALARRLDEIKGLLIKEKA